jgi:SAM-dependent methyltransferase
MFRESDYPQFGRPTGEDGRSLLERMNEHHRGLSEWALTNVPDLRCDMILDIGCGGGMLISLLAERFPDADICGVDISEESVEMTRKVNSDLVAGGRCRVSLDSVSELPFGPGTFDLVTAFETYFFWPDLENDLPKAAATVREGGYLVVVSEMYPHPDFNERNDEAAALSGLRLRDNDEMAAMMEGCGLSVTVNVIEEKNWVAFVGRKVTFS